jgi:hypothetical protein
LAYQPFSLGVIEMATFGQMRAEFIRKRRGAVSLPMTGVINYGLGAAASLAVPEGYRNLVLALCFWAIPPVAALIGRLRGEDFGGSSDNPLFQLSKLARIMVLATWAIHIPVWIYAPALFPLTVGIAFALHWVVFGWSLGHPLGLVHLGLRAITVPAAWYLAPDNHVAAVAAVVTLCYAFSVVQLLRLDWDRLAAQAEAAAPDSATA